MLPTLSTGAPDSPRRQRGHIFDGPADPSYKRLFARKPRRPDVYEPGHRPTGEIHRSGMWPRERPPVSLRSDPDHEIRPEYPAAHRAVEQEGEPAEHPPLG